jgi:hypothetical protein
LTVRKVFNKRLRHQKDGVNVAAEINAVVATTSGKGETNAVKSKSHARIVQNSGDARPAPEDKEER